MKQLLVLLFLLCSVGISAQDIIVMKDGSIIASKVIEVGQNEIKYKKYNNQDGPLYTISKTSVQSINYQNGAKDTFSAPVREENRYLPNNQNDGYRQVNDRALVNIDSQIQKPYKKAKTLRIIGIAGGIALEIAGVVLLSSCTYYDHINGNIRKQTDEPMKIGGIACIVGGVACTTTCLLIAHNISKKAKIQNVSLYQQKFEFNNGTSLIPSIDLLKDQALNIQTFGFGLRYNF